MQDHKIFFWTTCFRKEEFYFDIVVSLCFPISFFWVPMFSVREMVLLLVVLHHGHPPKDEDILKLIKLTIGLSSLFGCLLHTLKGPLS